MNYPVLRQLLTWILLLAWGTQIVYLYPTPPQSIQRWYEYADKNPDSYIWEDFAAKDEETSESAKKRHVQEKFGPRIWVRWLFLMALILLGISSIGLLKRWRRGGAIGILLLSGLYFLFWATQPGGFLTEWTARLAIAQEQGTELLFIHKQLVLPALFIVVVVICLIILFASRNRLHD